MKRRFWFLSPWNLHTNGRTWSSFKERLSTIYAQLKNQGRLDILDYVVCTLWSLWKARNRIIFEEKRECWAQIWEAGVHLADDFAAGNCKGEATNASTTDDTDNSAGRWQIPETGYMKFNIDAALNATTNSGAAGVIRRNDKGEFWGRDPHC
ncbi:hypothetical protein LIER_14573 [Lithospermum erythrorhizon]|uniref:Uncharacterized protein n=1 Tax=Lithospermum erythrorhizon TaxID=34254 RepID=A0AAV3Q169_LITER